MVILGVRRSAGVVVASLLGGGAIVAACGGDTDLSACILPDPADRLALRQQTYVKAPAAASTASRFGAEVALSADGSTLAVGAPYDPSGALGVNADPTDRSRTNAGAVHVFVRSGATWAKEAYLKPASRFAAVEFGRSLALSKTGDTLIVGVPEDWNPKFDSSGTAVVFRRSGTRWVEEAYLRPSRGSVAFGTAVALSHDGDTAVVGAPEDTGGTGSDKPCDTPPCRGAAFVFTRASERWKESAILEPPRSLDLPSPVFTAVKMGARVALSGDGTVMATLATGAVATFTRGATWAFETSAPLPAPRYEVDRSIGRGMGNRGYVAPWMSLGMSSDGRTIAVGEPYPPSEGNTFTSRVEIFARQDAQLRRTAVVQALASRPNSNFGYEIALSASGTHLAVGAYADSGGQGGTNPDPCGATVDFAGAAYLFTLDGAAWKERAFLKGRRVKREAYFGGSVALDALGATLVVGAPGDSSSASGIDGDESDTSAPYAGAAYVFR